MKKPIDSNRVFKRLEKFAGVLIEVGRASKKGNLVITELERVADQKKVVVLCVLCSGEGKDGADVLHPIAEMMLGGTTVWSPAKGDLYALDSNGKYVVGGWLK